MENPDICMTSLSISLGCIVQRSECLIFGIDKYNLEIHLIQITKQRSSKTCSTQPLMFVFEIFILYPF